MRLLYTLTMHLLSAVIRFAARFDSKARKWVVGRRGWRALLKEAWANQTDPIWFHCASLGEFEQGRPLIEAIKTKYPDQLILLTFFSPSGYDLRKNYTFADYVCYLPPDYLSNARDFIRLAHPRAAIFVKYDIWLNYLLTLSEHNIPNYLISALIGPKSSFLRPLFRPVFKRAFRTFDHIFTQNEETRCLLSSLCGHDHFTVSGDTRFDRAFSLAENAQPLPKIQQFKGDAFCIVAGSPWPQDEKILLMAIEATKNLPIRWILAPHEINRNRISRYCKEDPGHNITWSTIDNLLPAHKVLWIDNIGMLGQIYRYADVCYIGGGFGRGIHNTQEAAIFGHPVAFGPKYNKFKEAVDLINLGAASLIENENDLVEFVLTYYNDREKLALDSETARNYMLNQAGATEILLAFLEREGLFG